MNLRGIILSRLRAGMSLRLGISLRYEDVSLFRQDQMETLPDEMQCLSRSKVRFFSEWGFHQSLSNAKIFESIVIGCTGTLVDCCAW
jgi:hypothetical protein